MFGWVVIIQVGERFERDGGEHAKISRGLIDLHHSAVLHEKFGECIAIRKPAETRPTVQGEGMFFAVAPFRLEQNFLMMTVAGGIRNTVNIRQAFRVRKIARIAKGEEQCNGLGCIDIFGNNECRP